MRPERLVVFLPCHSLDDFPTWLDDREADELLAAWTAAWHPALIAAVGSAPEWASVEAPPADGATLLGIVPPACDERFAALLDMAGLAGSWFVRDTPGCDAAVAAAVAALDSAGMEVATTASLVPDFQALGLARLLTELLARRMRSSTGIIAADFSVAAVNAARAAVAGDESAARDGLRECFGMLETTRQQYYPVDVWLLDLVLVADSTLGRRLAGELGSPVPLALLATGRLLERLECDDPDLLARLRDRVADGGVEVVGGRDEETPVDGLLLESLAMSLERGHATHTRLLGRAPVTFGQCTGGSSAFLPGLLHERGYRGAIWNLFDGTPLPEPGANRIRWQGPDGVAIEAVAQPPLDARAAGTILQLADKIGDAMDHHHACIVSFAHHAGTASPWFAALRRIAAWTTVLGRFVTPATLFAETPDAGMLADFPPDAFPPTLSDESALEPAARIDGHVARTEAEAAAMAIETLSCTLPPSRLSASSERRRGAATPWRRFFARSAPDDERLVLANALLRVAVHPTSGGILSLRAPDGRGNRLSQVLAVRSTRAAPPVGAAWESVEERAEYARMEADRIDRESTASIVSRGRFVSASGAVLGSFTQRLALVEGQPLVRLDVECTLDRPLAGPLFEAHLACRFAWNENDDVDLRRSLHGASIVTERTRFTAPHFLEIEPVGDRSRHDRVLIATGGLPFHVRSTAHTVDSILTAAGGRAVSRRFVLGLGIGSPRPVALALLQDRTCVPPATAGATT